MLLLTQAPIGFIRPRSGVAPSVNWGRILLLLPTLSTNDKDMICSPKMGLDTLVFDAGGNTGSQAVASVIRAMAMGKFTFLQGNFQLQNL